MKVLLISHGFQPSYEKGFANGLARNGVAVELIGSDRTLKDIDNVVNVINLRGSQDPNRIRTQKALNYLRYLIRIYQHIFSGKVPVIHLNGMLLGGVGLLAVVECILYRLAASKFFLTVHNIIPHDNYAKTSRFYLRMLYRIPHSLVVHTEKMKRALMEEYGVTAKRIVVMPHGVDQIPDEVATPMPDTSLRVLLFGGVQPYKGVDIFLCSLGLCGDFPISAKIVGEARNLRYANEIREMIGAVREPHSVEWVQGFVAENQAIFRLIFAQFVKPNRARLIGLHQFFKAVHTADGRAVNCNRFVALLNSGLGGGRIRLRNHNDRFRRFKI